MSKRSEDAAARVDDLLAVLVGEMHELKTHPGPFDLILAGQKTFELRSTADRTFAAGDILRLRRWSPILEDYAPTADGIASVLVRVTQAMHGPAYGGLAAGFAILSIRPLDPCEAAAVLAEVAPTSAGEITTTTPEGADA